MLVTKALIDAIVYMTTTDLLHFIDLYKEKEVGAMDGENVALLWDRRGRKSTLKCYVKGNYRNSKIKDLITILKEDGKTDDEIIRIFNHFLFE